MSNPDHLPSLIGFKTLVSPGTPAGGLVIRTLNTPAAAVHSTLQVSPHFIYDEPYWCIPNAWSATPQCLEACFEELGEEAAQLFVVLEGCGSGMTMSSLSIWGEGYEAATYAPIEAPDPDPKIRLHGSHSSGVVEAGPDPKVHVLSLDPL